MTRPQSRWVRWPGAGNMETPPRIAYGADYNPEQWSEDVWDEDVALMREAGVNLVNVAIFSWALLEPEPDHFRFDQLDRVVDLLHGNGIAVDLATATASPPPWLIEAHPEVLPVDDKGHVLHFGARQSWCSVSTVYRERSLHLVEAVAGRYAKHPGLAMWHVSNELGCHNSRCYCDASAAAFRSWLTKRYTSIDDLNHAWGTAFWSQHYTRWEQVGVPKLTPGFPNPTQQLDFARFSSEALLDQFVAERDVLRRITPDVPVTTNFMVMGETKNMDYASWAPHLDFVSNDHYLLAGHDEPDLELAMSSDIVRGTAGGDPWMVMEHSTGAVNWQEVNRPKRPGQMRRNSLAQVARGADAVSFFQWRQSSAGAEKFHSAMVPHAGPDSRVFREATALGADLGLLAELVGSRVSSQVAFLFDWPSWWASELDSHPSQQFSYRSTVEALYAPFWRTGVSADLVPVDTDLSGYRLLVVPALYLVDDATAERVAAFADDGGTVLVTYFSGIVDQNDHARLGGYPGAFRDLVGVRVEEFAPMWRGQTTLLADGSSASLWAEDVHVTDAQVRLRFAISDEVFSDGPALTRRPTSGGGAAWYLATLPEPTRLASLVDELCREARVEPVAKADGPLEMVRRVEVATGQSWLFALNHGRKEVTVRASGTDLLTGKEHEAVSTVPAGAVVILRERPTSREQ